MGWFDITYISMDERGLDLLKPAVSVIGSVTNEEGESFKISSAMNAESLHEREFLKRVDDISINLDNAGDVELMNEVSAERRELGLKTTYYTCTGNYPGNFMISDPGDNYWTAWYALTLGTDGFMRWAWDNYLYDMFGDATYRYWEPGDGWYMYPVERGTEDTAESTVYSTPRYEMFKQGVRDACKAKYLLASDKVTEEQKEAYSAIVENLQRPAKTTYAGAAVPANEDQRMLAHSETARALEATNDLARQIADQTGPSGPDSGDNDKPGTGEDKPGTGEDKPGAGTDTPDAGDDRPDAGKDKPASGSSTPKTGDGAGFLPQMTALVLAAAAGVAAKKRLTNKRR